MGFKGALSERILAAALTVICLGVSGCSVAEPKIAATTEPSAPNTAAADPKTADTANSSSIEITPNGPADTVRAFYSLLRQKKFREAIFLTNLRPAFEGLTDTELQDFAVDFAELAGEIPAEIKINGEIVAGEKATVTADLPADDGEMKVQTINLRKSGDIWIIQTTDDETAKKIVKEGKQYFYNLRIETHEREAQKMLERVSKAQFAHSLQNGGALADIETLIKSGLLPDDIRSSDSTGYNYALILAPDKRSFHATATPAVYGKSGRQSFILKIDPKGQARVSGKDVGGKPLSN